MAEEKFYPLQVCIVKSQKTERWHPIYFRYAPLPSGFGEDDGFSRYKSGGHHTEGFATKEEAEKGLEQLEGDLKKHFEAEVCRCPDYEIGDEDFVSSPLLKMDGNYGEPKKEEANG